MNDYTMDLLKSLRLFGMHDALEGELAVAVHEGLSCQEVIHNLVLKEFHYRQEKNLTNRIKSARLPWQWTLSSFPFERQPGVNKSQIMGLAGLSFLERAENVIFIGDPGTGKTGLAIGLLRQALSSGHRGRFYKAQDLTDELYASLADRSSPKLIRSLSRYDLLVIDELGYLTLNDEQINAFFKLMEERYSRKSTIITTNLDYPQWYGLFEKKSLVDALLDRLKHHCVTIRINGHSLRVPADESAEKAGTPIIGEATPAKKKTTLKTAP